MRKRKAIWGLVVAGLLAAVLIGQGLSQEAQPQQPAGRAAPRGRRRWNPEQVRQRMLERVKETIGATEEEWKELQPRVEKVQTLSLQTRGLMGRGMRFGRGGRRPQPAAGAEAPKPTELEEATRELRQLLENPDAADADIKARLAALRDARKKAQEELAKAQKELREIATARQEAHLVLMGLLD